MLQLIPLSIGHAAADFHGAAQSSNVFFLTKLSRPVSRSGLLLSTNRFVGAYLRLWEDEISATVQVEVVNLFHHQLLFHFANARGPIIAAYVDRARGAKYSLEGWAISRFSPMVESMIMDNWLRSANPCDNRTCSVGSLGTIGSQCRICRLGREPTSWMKTRVMARPSGALLIATLNKPLACAS